MNDADRTISLKTIQSELGIDLPIANRGYAPIKSRRYLGSAIHKAFSRGVVLYESTDEIMTDDFQKDITKLRPGKHITNGEMLAQVEVQGYLEFFNQYGTHFVSKVSMGDIIYQVFTYEKEDFLIVKAALAEHPEQFLGCWLLLFPFILAPRIFRLWKCCSNRKALLP